MISMDLIPIVWIGVAVVFAIIEAITTGLTSIWFAAGAAIASIISLFTDNIIIQAAVFIVVSVALLVLTRPIVKKHINRKIERTNVDALLGMNGIVVSAIGKSECGAVRADGKVWTATAEDSIEAGTEVKITGISGVTVTVTPKE